jgi:hypothetical protein
MSWFDFSWWTMLVKLTSLVNFSLPSDVGGIHSPITPRAVNKTSSRCKDGLAGDYRVYDPCH